MLIEAITKNRRIICTVESGANDDSDLIRSYKFMIERYGKYQSLFDIYVYKSNIEAYVTFINSRDLYANWRAIEEYLNSQTIYSSQFGEDGFSYLQLNIDSSLKKNIQLPCSYKTRGVNVNAEIHHTKMQTSYSRLEIDNRKEFEMPVVISFF